MPKRGRVSASMDGLRRLGEALNAMRKGRVDVGFFAGEAERNGESPAKAAARARRRAKLTGEGSRPGFYKQGVGYAKTRATLARGQNAEGLTNPEIAAKHEFGLGVPRRSMLRMPLHLHGDKVVAAAKADAARSLREAARAPKKTAEKVLKRVGIAAEGLVDEAFETGGFGSWKPLAPLTVELKGSAAILIDTAQLRRAVDSRAVL